MITVLLHVLLLAGFLLSKRLVTKPLSPSKTDITYISPLPIKEKPKPKPLPRNNDKPSAKPNTAAKQVVMKMDRLPNTITPPQEPVVQVAPEPPKILKLDPDADMSAILEAKRRARGQVTEQVEESEADRGNRLARENIAAANRRGNGTDHDDGTIEVLNKSFNGADIKFNNWNVNFKRRWLQQVHVDLGLERDIETAVIKRMIQMIRKEAPGDFTFDSHRLGRKVNLSGRVQDNAELEAFLFKEYFPDYRPPRER
ncbi:MAG: hypothetical protein ACJ8GW_02860 [Massilia sp.]